MRMEVRPAAMVLANRKYDVALNATSTNAILKACLVTKLKSPYRQQANNFLSHRVCNGRARAKILGRAADRRWYMTQFENFPQSLWIVAVSVVASLIPMAEVAKDLDTQLQHVNETLVSSPILSFGTWTLVLALQFAVLKQSTGLGTFK